MPRQLTQHMSHRRLGYLVGKVQGGNASTRYLTEKVGGEERSHLTGPSRMCTSQRWTSPLSPVVSPAQDHLIRDINAGRFANNTALVLVTHGLALRVLLMRW